MMYRDLEISDRFDLDDIRKIRDYNAQRYASMTREEIIADKRAGAERVLRRMEELKKRNNGTQSGD